MGEQPGGAEAKIVYGVVVEVALNGGMDMVVAYADLTSRYFNYTGSGVVWERPDASLDATVTRVLDVGRTLALQIGPWEKARPPAPPQGQARINMLTPSGLHFGQAAFDDLSKDALAAPLLSTATKLTTELIAKDKSYSG